MLPITGKIILSNNNQLDCFQGISVVPRRGKCRIQQVYLLDRLLADHFFALFFDVIWTCFAQYFHIFAHPLHTLCVRTHLLNSLQINIDIFYSLEILFMEIWFFLMTLMSEKIVLSYIMLMWS